MNSALAQEQVRQYWDGRPCDSDLSDQNRLWREYFLDIERQRYDLQPHILDVISKIDWRGKRVLEIGSGVGSGARTIIGRGGVYTGSMSIGRRPRRRCRHCGPFRSLASRCKAMRLPLISRMARSTCCTIFPKWKRPSQKFIAFSIPGASCWRCCTTARRSTTSLKSGFLRKAALRVLSVPGAIACLERMGFPRRKIERHRELARQDGKMKDDEWLSRNTDGPDNPYSRVYGAEEAQALLSAFRMTGNEVYFFDYRHWGALGRLLPESCRRALGRRWGWHRIVHAEKI
jgi:hypothetical protein